MRTLLVYHSSGGNTEALMNEINSRLSNVDVFKVTDLNFEIIKNYDGLIVGTYTWGNGNLPDEMVKFYYKLHDIDLRNMVTAVFGTGETSFKNYCKAVDIFRDLFKEVSELSVTLKIEQLLNENDMNRVEKFCELYNNRIYKYGKYLANIS